MQSDSDNIRVICYLCPIKLFYPKLIFFESLGRFTHHREKRKIHWQHLWIELLQVNNHNQTQPHLVWSSYLINWSNINLLLFTSKQASEAGYFFFFLIYHNSEFLKYFKKATDTVLNTNHIFNLLPRSKRFWKSLNVESSGTLEQPTATTWSALQVCFYILYCLSPSICFVY